MRRIIALLMLLAVWGTASYSLAAIAFDVNQTYAEVNDGASTFSDTDDNTPGTISYASTVGYSSETTSIFSPLGLLKGTFVQSRLGTANGLSYGSVSATFQTTMHAYYEATGNFTNSAGFTALGSYLFDYDTNTFLYDSSQFKFDGPVALVLGGAGGDINTFTGSLTGSLLPGHKYSWVSYGQTQALSDDAGASAGGFASLSIFPEPGSVIVWVLAAAVMGGAGWWRRAKLAP